MRGDRSVCGEGGMCVCVCCHEKFGPRDHFWLPKIVDPETGRYWSVRTKSGFKMYKCQVHNENAT